MQTHIHFVRHGESAANAGLPTDDPALIPLTDVGRCQAKTVAALLDIQPSSVITSHYERAKDTGKPFAERWSVQASHDPLLHEFTTLAPAAVVGMDVHARKPLVDAYWDTADPELRHGVGSESFIEFASRVRAFRLGLHELSDQTVIFGHGMWFAMMIWQLQGFGFDSTISMRAFRRFQLGLPMPNCGIYTLTSQSEDTWDVQFNEEIYRTLVQSVGCL